MKYIILLLVLYAVYRYWKYQSPLLPSQEEGEYIDYEEVVDEEKPIEK